MEDFERFIAAHSDADVPKLLLSCREWPKLSEEKAAVGLSPKDLTANTILARQKLRKKLPEWHGRTDLLYPDTLCAEQCSSSGTARYKARLAERIMAEYGDGRPGFIADLTGGLGADAWAFSSVAKEVLYNDMNPALATAAKHNFSRLGAMNISVRGEEIRPGNLASILLKPADIIFLDPARRDGAGKKVFLLEDCSPDVTKLLPELLGKTRHVLLKLSPMADIVMIVRRLREAGLCGCHGLIREIHAVAEGGECKEVLAWLDSGWKDDEYELICSENGHILSFKRSEIDSATALERPSMDELQYLFEPGKSITKSGAFNAICGRFGLKKLSAHTHLYSLDADNKELTQNLKHFGKIFKVLEIRPLNNGSIKDLGKIYTHAAVSARNIPLTSDQLQKKLRVTPGPSEAHIFGTRIDFAEAAGNFLVTVSSTT